MPGEWVAPGVIDSWFGRWLLLLGQLFVHHWSEVAGPLSFPGGQCRIASEGPNQRRTTPQGRAPQLWVRRCPRRATICRAAGCLTLRPRATKELREA